MQRTFDFRALYRFLAMLVLVCALGLSAGCAASSVTGSPAVAIVEGESLRIDISEVTDKASFYPVNIDGTEMEVLAIRDSNGDVRTAFNTCESCYSSGRGYYEQEGDLIVCQNCGQGFTADQVEAMGRGGCNPYPIFASDKTVTDDAIEIGYAFLKESKGIFDNWKM